VQQVACQGRWRCQDTDDAAAGAGCGWLHRRHHSYKGDRREATAQIGKRRRAGSVAGDYHEFCAARDEPCRARGGNCAQFIGRTRSVWAARLICQIEQIFPWQETTHLAQDSHSTDTAVEQSNRSRTLI
jgi:hypothetical protein